MNSPAVAGYITAMHARVIVPRVIRQPSITVPAEVCAAEFVDPLRGPG